MATAVDSGGVHELFAPPAPDAVRAGVAGAASTASLLGLSTEHELDDFKAEAHHLTAAPTKRAKLSHVHFFDNEGGFKRILKEFPGIKFRGKGNEFDDLRVLLRHYGQWFKDLYPSSEKLEDLVWKARTVLQEKEVGPDGPSDPRERLHMLRYEYKTAKRKAAESASWSTPGSAQLSEEARKRIAENRQRALELKKKKAAAAGLQGDGLPSAVSADDKLDAGGLDMETLWAIEEKRQRALDLKRNRQAEAAGCEDEEDVFGFGGGLDGNEFAGSAKPQASGPPNGMFDDEEDVFGFGGGLDEEDAPAPPQQSGIPPAPPPTAPTVQQQEAPPARAPRTQEVNDSARRMIEEKRQKALELKRKRQAEAASSAGSAGPSVGVPTAAGEEQQQLQQQPQQQPQQPPQQQSQQQQQHHHHHQQQASTPSAEAGNAGPDYFFDPFEEEEDVFGLGGGMDD